jgi:hypothetical protein
MDRKSGSLATNHAPDGLLVWADFEARRLEFWDMVRDHAEASDQELARLPSYNAFLHYGLTAYRTIGAEACRILALAFLQGHPEPLKAEAVLQRFWRGLLPDGGFGQDASRWHISGFATAG